MSGYADPGPTVLRSDPPRDESGDFLRGGGAAADLDVLADRRRRIALQHLRRSEEEWVPVAALARRIAEWEVELGEPGSVESIEIDLIHGHLPKLEATGTIDRDADGQRVAYRGDDSVERFLDLSRQEWPLP